MILYNETINIEQTVEVQWLEWIKRKHIVDVMNTGCFITARLSRLSSHVEPNSTNYTVQYLCENSDNLKEFKTLHEQKLREEAIQIFGHKMQTFNTELDVIEDFFPNQS